MTLVFNQVRKNMKKTKSRVPDWVQRCTIILLGLSAFGFGVGMMTPKKEEAAVKLKIHEELKVADGETPVKMSVDMEDLRGFSGRLTVNERKYEILDGESLEQLEFPIYDLNEETIVDLKIEKKGFRKETKEAYVKIDSFSHIDMYQKVVDYEVTSEVIRFVHQIDKAVWDRMDKNKVSYQLKNSNGEILQEFVPMYEIQDDKVLYEIELPNQFSEELTLMFSVVYEIDEVAYELIVKDFDMSYQSVQTDKGNFIPMFFNQKMLLINQSIEKATYEEHQFFAESLHIGVSEQEGISSYQLIEFGEVKYQGDYHSIGNDAIDLTGIDDGRYVISLNNKPVYTDEFIFQTWYTIYREGVSKKITLEAELGVLILDVQEVYGVPENIYDIVIDPGHGGFDPGTSHAGYTEANEVLKFSELLAERFADHGLKVLLTRTEDLDPSGRSDVEYNVMPYIEAGRVDKVYSSQAKYVISNHLNALDGKTAGFEVYSSVFSTNEWSDLVVTEMKGIGRKIHDSLNNAFRVSEGVYKRSYDCEPDITYNYACRANKVDYLYILRESGGALTQPIGIVKNNSKYKKAPNYGAESILVEYAYLDNEVDRLDWLSHWEDYVEVIVEATLKYLNIPYVE